MNKQVAVRKSWTMFWLVEVSLVGLGAVAWVLFPGVSIAVLSALVLLSAILLPYYYRLEYTVTKGALKITSGLLFRKHRLLPPENILWETRLILPPFTHPVMVILHTAGGRAVIFGDYNSQ
ncbi:MAG: hypothetical protein ACI4WS_12040 [Oscillospiraceae bacterium]